MGGPRSQILKTPGLHDTNKIIRLQVTSFTFEMIFFFFLLQWVLFFVWHKSDSILPVSKTMRHQKNSFCSICQTSVAQWEAPLFVTHNPLTNIVYNVSAPGCLWVLKCVCKNCQGRFAHVISSAREAADENGGNALIFLLASYERSHCSLLKNHTVSLELLIATQAALFFFPGESWLKSPFPCSFPPHPPLCRMPCTVTNLS